MDPTETPERLQAYWEANGWPWPLTPAYPEVALLYRVQTQATKVGIDRTGRVVLRKGYGGMGPEDWEAWLSRLAGE